MLINVSAIAAIEERVYRHPLNDRAVRRMRSLGEAAGLEHLGVHLVRLEPGRESTEYHLHHVEEECIYVLSGKGRAEIGGQVMDVGPGDFMGFAAGGNAHTLVNSGSEDLEYLVFGQRCPFDVCDYPRIGKRLYRLGGDTRLVPLDPV